MIRASGHHHKSDASKRLKVLLLNTLISLHYFQAASATHTLKQHINNQMQSNCLRTCSMLREPIYPFQQHAGAGELKCLRFKHYVATNQDKVDDFDAKPLLDLVKANDVGGKLPDLSLGEIPFSTSPDVAMLLGFIAYSLPTLNLVQLEAAELLGDQAPHAHPFGGFSFLPLDALSDLLGKSSARISCAPCNFDLENSSRWVSSSESLQEFQIKEASEMLLRAQEELAKLKRQVGRNEEYVRALQDDLDACMKGTLPSTAAV